MAYLIVRTKYFDKVDEYIFSVEAATNTINFKERNATQFIS